MNRRIITRTSGGSRMRYARRRMNRKAQESRKEGGAPMKRVSGPNGSERFLAKQSVGQEFVSLHKIGLIKKEIRKHPPRSDGL